MIITRILFFIEPKKRKKKKKRLRHNCGRLEPQKNVSRPEPGWQCIHLRENNAGSKVYIYFLDFIILFFG